MTFHPNKARTDAIGVNRVVEISQFDRVDPNPDQLCLLKRLVDQYDVLRAANPAAFATAVGLVNARYRRMFTGSNLDQYRFRYLVYGSDEDTQANVYTTLYTAITPATTGASQWWRNSTIVGDVTTWTEVLTANHMTANAARAPTGVASSGLDFDTNDCMGFTLNAVSFNAEAFWFYLWVKPDAVAASQTLLSISIGTGGANARTLVLMFGTSSIMCDIFVSGTAGRRALVAGQAAAGTARLWGVEYNNSKVGEANKVTLTRDANILVPTFSDVGLGGALGSLVNPLPGKGLIGNFNDGVASNPLNGVVGRNAFAGVAAMAGSTVGCLTTAARNAIFALEPLT